MKSRAMLLAGVLAVTMLSASMASASAASRPTQPTKHSLRPRAADTTTNTFCLNTAGTSCLNVEDCNSLGSDVQLYNIYTGGDCSYNWNADPHGTVGESAGNVFTCGHDWNATYYGDQVYLMDFDYTDPDLQYYPIGTGNDDQVEMTNVVADGVFVATGNSSDTKLIDASASCAGSNPELQWIYATGTTNGAEVKESTDPAKLLFWAYSTWGN